MINGIVGNGISGILYKWVNYGRGWRPRWFVIHDGVLSYFKIHGANKLVLNSEVEKGSMVIGEESLRRIASHRNNPSRHRKPVCEIHLMVLIQFRPIIDMIPFSSNWIRNVCNCECNVA